MDGSKAMKNIALILIILLVSANAHADTWLNIGGPSYHTDRTKTFNEQNYGLGLRYDIDDASFVSAGYYDNSVSQRSRYAVYGRELASYKQAGFGAVVGTVDGYKLNEGKFIPFAAPYISFAVFNRLSADVVYVPKVEKKVSAVFGLQLRIRL